MLARQLQFIGQGLVVIALLLAAIAAALWLRPAETASGQAMAYTRVVTPADRTDVPGIPDSGRQRMDMIAELRKTNEQLSTLVQGLKDGTFTVIVKAPEGQGDVVIQLKKDE